MCLTESPCLGEDTSHFKMTFVPHSAYSSGGALKRTISGHKEDGKKSLFCQFKRTFKRISDPCTRLSQTLCGRLEQSEQAES